MTHFFYSASIYIKEYFRGDVTDEELEEDLSIRNREAQETLRKRQETLRKRQETLRKREKEKREAG